MSIPASKNFIYPLHMQPIVKEIVEGEYDLDLNLKHPVIADVGANLGIFTLWALRRWPDAFVYCYEPSIYNFHFLKQNFDGNSQVKLFNFALGKTTRTKLFKGRSNCGQASFFKTSEQQDSYEIVKTKSPSVIPKDCDILKIDTEGCEVEILSGLKDRRFRAVLVEYHSEVDRELILKLLSDYSLVESHETWINHGILKFIHL